MPTVSGETLALPPLKSSQAFACTAGKTAFCAASPNEGANSAPRLFGVLLDRLAVGDVLRPDALERLDDVVRHALGQEDAEVVGGGREARHRVRQRRDRAEALELERLVAHGGERAQALATDHVGLLDRELGRHLGLAGHGGDDGGIAAVVGDVAVGDASRLRDQLHRVVPRRRDARGRDRDLAGVGLHRVEQLLGVLVRRARIDADDLDVGDGEEEVPVLDRRVQRAERLVGAEVLRRSRGPGVAVLRGVHRALGADRSRGAGLVDDDDRLAERLLELGGSDARDLVGRAARRPRHDQVDRPGRLPVLRRGGAGGCRERGEESDVPADAGRNHAGLLLVVFAIGAACGVPEAPGLRRGGEGWRT